MMAYSEDHIALAAEYALGPLDADERAQVETMMSVDKDFTAMVHAWEYRLGVLNQMVGSVEPRPEVWERIRTATGLSEPQAPLLLPDAPPRAREKNQTRAGAFGAAGAAAASRRAAAAGGAGNRRGRGQFQRHPLVHAGPALAQCCGGHDGDRSRPGRDDRGRGLSAGLAARRPSPQTANPTGRSKDPVCPGAFRAICR